MSLLHPLAVAIALLVAPGPQAPVASPPTRQAPSPAAQAPPPAPPGDPAAHFQALMEGYYGAYARKDLAAMATAWHPQGPARYGRNVFELEFETRDVVFEGLRLGDVMVDPGGGKARAVIALHVTDRRSGHTRTERRVRDLTFLPHEGAWRLWNEASAGMPLARRLLATPPDQIDALLAAEPELLSDDALHGLAAEARSLRSRAAFPVAHDVTELRLKVARAAGNDVVAANCLVDIGLQHQMNGRLALAGTAFREARVLLEKVGTAKELALVDMNLAAVDYLEGRYPAALTGYERALRVFEAEGDRASTASTLHSLGNTRYMLGEHEQALESYAASLAISQETGNQAGTAAVQLAIGLVNRDLGNYAEAGAAYRNAAGVSEAIADVVGAARAYQGLGEIHRLEGDYGQALEALHASLARWEKTLDAPNRAAATFAVGQVYALQRSFSIAADWYARALTLDRASGEEGGIARDLGGLAGVHVALGQPETALAQYEESLGLREKLEDRTGAMWTLVHLAALHVSQGRPEDALRSCQRAIGIAEGLGDRAGLATALALTAGARLAAEDADAAIEAAARASEIARQIGRFDVLAYAGTVTGKAHARAARIEEARASLEGAVSALNQVPIGPGSETFFDDRRGPYGALADLLAAQHRAAEAFTWYERGRQHLLATMLGVDGAIVTKGLSPAERDEERRLLRATRAVKAKLAGEAVRAHPDEARRARLQAELASLAEQREAFRQRLFAAHPKLPALRAEVDPAITLGSAPLLQRGDIALAFSAGDTTLTMFIVSQPAPAGPEPAGLHVESVAVEVKAGDLATLVSRFQKALAANDAEAVPIGDELSALLLQPVRTWLAHKTRVWIVPDRFLWGLPFEALRVPSGRYLIEDAAVSYLPSLASLALYREVNGLPTRPALLAAGSPAASTVAVERLGLQKPGIVAPGPAGGREARAVAALFGASRSKVLTGRAASTQAVLGGVAPGGVLHLAVPAVLNDASPFYSSLVLSPDAGDQQAEGLLDTADWMGWDLQAGLAVFPAAEGVQPLTNGEALTALSWSLLVAGTPTVVASRWPVAPAAARRGSDLLVTGFYRALLQPLASPGMERAAAPALRSAARRLLAAPAPGPRHPGRWARLIVIGR
ncbi:MAG TPA: CHAT domain-containing tetratricopeptide repeat protein [Vicinamibacterales bacterium]|nr:CHAT domain-containing tetratricopeptide repeat protein [Vicinamibacterales bacterium]